MNFYPVLLFCAMSFQGDVDYDKCTVVFHPEPTLQYKYEKDCYAEALEIFKLPEAEMVASAKLYEKYGWRQDVVGGADCVTEEVKEMLDGV